MRATFALAAYVSACASDASQTAPSQGGAGVAGGIGGQPSASTGLAGAAPQPSAGMSLAGAGGAAGAIGTAPAADGGRSGATGRGAMQPRDMDAATPDAATDAGMPAAASCNNPKVVCTNGMAGPYSCSGVDMLARIPLADFGARAGNAIWGGVESRLKREIAVVGLDSATAFVDVSNPSCPVQLGRLPSTSSRSPTHDVKVIGDYALIVAEINNHGLQIFDMRTLGTTASTAMLTPTATYRGGNGAMITNAHDVVVNPATNFVYIVGSRSCMGGLHMVDFRDPMKPAFAGCGSNDHYVHDAECVVYAGPDKQYTGREICVTYNGDDSFSIVDVQDKTSPKLLSRTKYTGGVYSHNGALTVDHSHLVLSDELDEQRNKHGTRTYLFNVSDLDKPVALPSYTAATKAIDHNLFIRGNFVYQANYEAGLRILDASGIVSGTLKEVAFFDTFPMLDAAELKGSWTAYPHFPSGIVIMNGTEGGMFVLAPQREVVALR